MPFPNPATQFRPGNPGGPGRPRRGIITDEAIDYLQEPHPKHEGKTRARVIAERMVDLAESDPDAREKLLDRVEGRPTQAIEADVKTTAEHVVFERVDSPRDQAVPPPAEAAGVRNE